MLIDAHLHLWDPARLRYDWLSHVPSINRAFLPADLTALSLPLEQAVFVQADCDPGQSLDEVDWVTGLDGAVRVGGIVAAAPLEKGDGVRDMLAALRTRPLVRGIRRSAQNEPVDFITDAGHLRGMELAVRAGFSLDICVRAPQLPAVVQALERLLAVVPGAVTILDHLGKPDIAAHGRDIHGDGWAASMARLARIPGLHCKLSGLTTQARWAGWRGEDLRPYLNHALACFGPGRCLFGGDWPVVNLAGGPMPWLALFETVCAEMSAADREMVRRGTARRVYRLE